MQLNRAFAKKALADMMVSTLYLHEVHDIVIFGE